MFLISMGINLYQYDELKITEERADITSPWCHS